MSDPTDDLLGAQGKDADGDGYEEIVVEYFDDGSSVATYDFNADGEIDGVDVDTDGDNQIDLAVVETSDGEVAVFTDPESSDAEPEIMSFDEAEELAPGLVDLLGEDHGEVDLADLDPSDLEDKPASNPFVFAPDKDEDEDEDRDRDEDKDRDDEDRDDDGDTEVVDPGKHPQGDPDGTSLVGDPFGEADLWFEQAVNGTCAPATVAQIVSEYTGQEFTDEQQFVDMAIDSGAMEVLPDGTTSGMYAHDIVTLLNDSGVPADLEDGLGVDDLKGFLADDVGVAVMVDADEYWNPMYGMPEEAEDDMPNHIVLVTGVDEEAGVVYINDTGTPDGEALAVPMDYFLDAWEDSGSQAVVCDEPAPDSQTVDIVDPDEDESDDDREREDDERDQGSSGMAESGLAKSATVSHLVDGRWALLPVVLSGDAAAAASK